MNGGAREGESSLSQECVDNMERALYSATLTERKRHFALLLNKIKEFHDHGDIKEATEKLCMIRNRQHELFARGLTPTLAKYDAEIISLCFNMINKSLRVDCGLDADLFSLQAFAQHIRRHMGKEVECGDGEVVSGEVDVTVSDLCTLVDLTAYDADQRVYEANLARREAQPLSDVFIPHVLTQPPLRILPTMSFLRSDTVRQNNEPDRQKPHITRCTANHAPQKILSTQVISDNDKDREIMKQKMKAALFMLSDRGNKAVPLYQVVLDRLYMSNTTKNLLMLSFLIQEGYVYIERASSTSEDDYSSVGPLVHINTDISESGVELFKSQHPANEMIVPVDHKLHTHMILVCEAFNIRPVMYHDKPNEGDMTDWGPYQKDEKTMMDAFVAQAQASGQN